MDAIRNEKTETWHLLGARGCGAEPDGEAVTGTWAAVRDRVERSGAAQCQNCHWPRG